MRWLAGRLADVQLAPQLDVGVGPTYPRVARDAHVEGDAGGLADGRTWRRRLLDGRAGDDDGGIRLRSGAPPGELGGSNDRALDVELPAHLRRAEIATHQDVPAHGRLESRPLDGQELVRMKRQVEARLAAGEEGDAACAVERASAAVGVQLGHVEGRAGRVPAGAELLVGHTRGGECQPPVVERDPAGRLRCGATAGDAHVEAHASGGVSHLPRCQDAYHGEIELLGP